MILDNKLRQKGLNLILLAASVMLLVGLASCSSDDLVAPEVVAADVADVAYVADVDKLLAAPPTWQGFSPILNNSEVAAGKIANIKKVVGDRTYSKGANPIVNGHGSWETAIGTVGFQVSVRELPDGTINGHGVSTMHAENGNGWFHFDVVDAAPYGDEIAVLGLITDAVNTPPNFLDSQMLLIIKDNEGNGSDMALSSAGLPPTLELDFILEFMDIPDFRFPVAHGNYKIH
jgi:hypothetical protein